MSEVIPFRPKPRDPENVQVIPDVPANHERDGQGPPIGTKAWMCMGCNCFAFYLTLTDTRCYECHAVQRFD
jgi:hypothetical protein